MRFALLSATIGVWLLSVAGCNSKSVAGCTKDDECPGGNVCLDRRCEKLCNDDNDCTAGRYCNGTICVVGDRSGQPEIAAVAGSGSDACVAEMGGPCIGTYFVVTGTNLGGSEFLLASADGLGTDYVLTPPIGGRVQDGLVDLAPQSGGDILAGDYVLVVSNSAGEDQAGVSLLKGEPGDDADLTGTEIVSRINASTATIDADNVTAMTGTEIVTAINDVGTTGVISSERVAGGSGDGGATLYEFIDGAAQTPTGHSGNRLVVRVNASTSAVASVALDTTDSDPESAGRVLLDLCADPDGCALSLGTVGWYYSAGVKYPAPYVKDDCRMFIDVGGGIDGSDGWSVSSSCSQRPITCLDADGELPCANEYLYIPHYSGQFGNDGYHATGGGDDAANDNRYIIYNLACGLSESPPVGNGLHDFDDDTARGFTFFASHPSWSGETYWVGDQYWNRSESDRACILIVED